MSDLHIWQGICIVLMVAITTANYLYEKKKGN